MVKLKNKESAWKILNTKETKVASLLITKNIRDAWLDKYHRPAAAGGK